MFCIPIIADNTEAALKKMAEASKESDLLELRLDLMGSFDLARMVQVSEKPVLVTYRSVREGGKGSNDPTTIGKSILNACGAGAEFVDLELWLPDEWKKNIMESKGDSKVVVSSHFFKGTPPRKELDRILQESIAAGGDVVKIVTMANDWEDILHVLDLIPTARKQEIEIAAFCMGAVGRISRVLSHLMGGYLTFTSLGSGQESAAGQIPVKEMKALIKIFGHQGTKEPSFS
jgi:3-dehydroquinate dehydratase type I